MSSLDAVRARFARNEGLPFADILTESRIREVLDEYGVQYRNRVFSPVTTIWGFLGQVLSDDRSCRDTVSRIIAHRTANGMSACSPNTASYCNARSRIHTSAIRCGGVGLAHFNNRAGITAMLPRSRVELSRPNLCKRHDDGQPAFRSQKATSLPGCGRFPPCHTEGEGKQAKACRKGRHQQSGPGVPWLRDEPPSDASPFHPPRVGCGEYARRA